MPIQTRAMNNLNLTEREKEQRIAELRAELRELEAVPRSDWHEAFEALLRIETHKYGNRVHISTEERIGEDPPRTDFVILIEDEKVAFEKAIFQIFRKINILEYKNPHDSLNERVIRKVCGYANLYIDIWRGEFEVRDVLMEIVQEDVDERVRKQVSTAKIATERETLASSIKNVMVNLKLTLAQAMDALNIPPAQRQTYASLVRGQMA